MVKFTWSASQFLFFLLFETLGVLLFTSLGIAVIALTPNVVAAAIISGDRPCQLYNRRCGYVMIMHLLCGMQRKLMACMVRRLLS
jgi:hypothetical protein